MSSNLKPIEAPALNPNYGENVKKTFENINSNFNVLANRELYKGDPGKTLLSANIPWEDIFQDQEYISIGDYKLTNFSNDIKSAIKELKQTISGSESEPGDDDQDVIATINGLKNSGSSLTVCFEEPEDSSIFTEVSTIIPFVYMDQRFRTSSFATLSDKFDMSCTIMYNGEWKCVQNFPTLYYKNDEDNAGGGLYWRINGQNTLILASGPAGMDGSTGEVYIGLTNDLKLYNEPENNGGTLDGNTETITITHLLIKGSPTIPDGVTTPYYPFLEIADWMTYCNGNQPPTTAPIIVLSSTPIDPIVKSETVLGVPYYIASTFVASAGTDTTVTANVSKYNICYTHVTNTTVKDALMHNIKRLPDSGELVASDLPGYVIREITGDAGYIIYAPSEGSNGAFSGGFVISYVNNVETIPPSPTFDNTKSYFHIIGNISHGYYNNAQDMDASGQGSHAEGYADSQGTIKATGPGSHAEGYADQGDITATHPGSHAEGYADQGEIQSAGTGNHSGGCANPNGQIISQGQGSFSFGHASGGMISARDNGSHAEGNADGGEISASSNGARATGCADTDGSIIASQAGAHAEGYAYEGDIMASGSGSHAEGYVEGADNYIKASGQGSHAEGYVNDGNIEASGKGSHAEGTNTTASGDYSHAEGDGTTANGNAAHAEGSGSISTGYQNIFARATNDGYSSYRWTIVYLPLNQNRLKSNLNSSEVTALTNALNGLTYQINSTTTWTLSATEMRYVGSRPSSPSGSMQNAVDYFTYNYANGPYIQLKLVDSTISSNNQGNIVNGSTSEGVNWWMNNYQSISGIVNTPQGYSHAEGYLSEARGPVSHAEGYLSEARGPVSHAEGLNTTASGDYSHAEGLNTIANMSGSHACGSYNAPGYVVVGTGTGTPIRYVAFLIKNLTDEHGAYLTSDEYRIVFSIGCGDSPDEMGQQHRTNAFVITANGSMFYLKKRYSYQSDARTYYGTHCDEYEGLMPTFA